MGMPQPGEPRPEGIVRIQNIREHDLIKWGDPTAATPRDRQGRPKLRRPIPRSAKHISRGLNAQVQIAFQAVRPAGPTLRMWLDHTVAGGARRIQVPSRNWGR